jgi:hypothetical protein
MQSRRAGNAGGAIKLRASIFCLRKSIVLKFSASLATIIKLTFQTDELQSQRTLQPRLRGPCFDLSARGTEAAPGT